MSRVNVDAIAFTDGRFKLLAELLGYIDADHARSKVEYVWLACTIRGELELPRWVVEQHLGPTGPEALVECELARWTSGRGDSRTRRMYICGARGRTEWFARLQGQSSKGGKARAEKTSRQAGRFTSQQGGAETSPLTPALAPALALAPAQQIPERDSATASPGGLVLVEPKAKPTRKPKPAPTPAEKAVADRVLAKLTEYSGVSYHRSPKHLERVVDRLRDGVTEGELRAVIVYCAVEKGWRGNTKMHQYLRPKTLFGPENIAEYLDEACCAYAEQIAKFKPDEPPPLALVPEAG